MASSQLVANLNRAAELIQSFKAGRGRSQTIPISAASISATSPSRW